MYYIKHTTLLICFCFSLNNALAQITITVADMPVAGTTNVYAFDTAYASGPGSSGGGQVWNFSGLLPNFTNTMVFKSPVGQPGVSNFPTSNLCMTFPADSTRQYLTINSSGFWVDGYFSNDTNNPFPLFRYNPPNEIITLPATYGTTSNSVSGYTMGMPGSPPNYDSARFQVSYYQNSVIDAWGTLSLPLGNYNVIRQNIFAITIDSVFYLQSGVWNFQTELRDTTLDYRWWANGFGVPLVEITQSPSNPYHGANFILSYTTGIPYSSNQSKYTELYPNPANDVLQVNIPKGVKAIVITDLAGKEILKKETSGGLTSIDVSTLVNGSYLLKSVSDGALGNYCTGFIVNH